jgi:hypothetical protein
MTLKDIRDFVFPKAFALLPAGMNTPAAQVILLTIGLQESRFEYRRQLGNGPARGFWQFEEGNSKSRAGVWGVMNHPASKEHMRKLCAHFGLPFTTKAVWSALETNDVLACCAARLLMYTDAAKLPQVNDAAGAWDMYAKRVWRPGKPHPETWNGFHAQAVKEVLN